MTEHELRKLQIYIGKNSYDQDNDDIIERIEKTNKKTPLTQEEWNALLFPTAYSANAEIMEYLLARITVISNPIEIICHVVDDYNRRLLQKRLDTLEVLLGAIDKTLLKECLSEALHTAVWCNEMLIAFCLIEKGANLSYIDKYGRDLGNCLDHAEEFYGQSYFKNILKSIFKAIKAMPTS